MDHFPGSSIYKKPKLENLLRRRRAKNKVAKQSRKRNRT